MEEDISKKIEESSKKDIVKKKIANKEEEIAKNIGKIPFARDDIERRKEKIISFVKKKSEWITYLILSFIIFISVYIRTRPIPNLKDITTGTWTLGPDLDPFLFLRWAKYIAEHGKLFLIDVMRYVPLADICSGSACNAINTAGETKLLPYMIAWLSKFLSVFNNEATVTYAAIIFPVIMAVLTGIAFFLFTRKLFYKEDKKIANIIALIATSFFILIPSLLPRTIAGIPEKESAAFFFIFIGFYFFLEGFTSEKLKRALIFGFLAGIFTGLLALIWGGVTFVFLGIAGAVLFAFLLGKINKRRFWTYFVWLISAVILMVVFSIRYSLIDLIKSSSTALVFGIFLILVVDFLLFKKRIFKLDEKIKRKIKLPPQVISFLITILFVIILASIFFGGSFIAHIGKDIISSTINPIDLGRFSVTVAENKQPYFINDWKNNFGPTQINLLGFLINTPPLYFWMMIAGSVMLFYNLINSLNKKEKIILTGSYFLMIICLIFSKYSSSSNLNGNSFLSLIIYFGGVLLFLAGFGYFYYKRYKEKEFSVFKNFNFSYILYFVMLTLAIISARGAVRLIMVLGAVSPIAIAFLIVKCSQRYLREKEDIKKLIFGIIILIVLIASISTLWIYYSNDKSVAENYAPGMYQWQWQKAMSWIRENTLEDAVFAHWWDYGYWVQSIGERATILDGGNALGYWNYFMGRNVLTGTNERDALDFLYAHNGTHLLIDSSDIGKYGAFSSIGSNENYDRYSWIQTIFLDESQTQETADEKIEVYPVGSLIDEDIIIEENGKEILLPRNQAGIAAILVRTKENKIIQPLIIFYYNGEQYQKSLKYLHIDGKLYEFDSGLNAGIFIFERMIDNGEWGISKHGAAFYLSRRVVDSQLARLYIFNEESNYFKLVHSENSLIVDELLNQGIDVGEFIYYPQVGVQGPIKIWEMEYPSDIKLDQTYLDTDYPEEIATINPEY